MELGEFASLSPGNTNSSSYPSAAPTFYEEIVDPNVTLVDIAEVEEIHETDAITVLLMNVTIIGCLLLAYYVKRYKIYYLPERYVRESVYYLARKLPARHGLFCANLQLYSLK